MKRTLLQYAVNIGLAFASILIILGLTETALRFTPYKNLLPIKQLDSLRQYLKADPVKGYDIRENAPPTAAFVDGLKYDIWSNELGCFDTPYHGENGPVLLVGDSFTFAFAPFNDKWGTKIEEFVGRRVLKCGVGGYGTKQELLKASDVISRINRRPKLIIVGYFINDLEDDYLFPNATIMDGYPIRTRDIKDMATGEVVKRKPAEMEGDKVYGVKVYPKNFLLKKIKWWLENQSVLYLLTKYSVRPLLLSMPVIKDLAIKTKMVTPLTLSFSDRPWLQNAWSGHFSNLRAFATLAKNNGAGLLVVIIPYKEQVYPYLTSWLGSDPERPQRLLCEFFTKEGIDYVDLLPLLRKYSNQAPHLLDPEKDLYWRNDPHLNIKGNTLSALLVSGYIMENDLLAVNDKEKRLILIKEKLDALKQQRGTGGA